MACFRRCYSRLSSWALRHSDNFIETNVVQKAVLTLGSTYLSLRAPWRGDMISICGELTGLKAAVELKRKMELSESGSHLLSVKPRINSTTINLAALSSYPSNTLGKVYSDWLSKNKVTPDTRLMVRFVEKSEPAYVIQRYREIHDLNHVILGMPINMLGETTVKAFEAVQTGFPMCFLGAIGGVTRLGPKSRKAYYEDNLPWAVHTGLNAKLLMNFEFENHFKEDIDALREKLNIQTLEEWKKYRKTEISE